MPCGVLEAPAVPRAVGDTSHNHGNKTLRACWGLCLMIRRPSRGSWRPHIARSAGPKTFQNLILRAGPKYALGAVPVLYRYLVSVCASWSGSIGGRTGSPTRRGGRGSCVAVFSVIATTCVKHSRLSRPPQEPPGCHKVPHYTRLHGGQQRHKIS